MFAYWVHVVLTHEYPIIWININPTCLLNGLRFLNPNTINLLNVLVESINLSDFIKIIKKNYKKTSK